MVSICVGSIASRPSRHPKESRHGSRRVPRPGKPAIETLPDPELIDDTDAIVRIDTTTICGTDRRPPHTRPSPPSPSRSARWRNGGNRRLAVARSTPLAGVSGKSRASAGKGMSTR